MMMLRRTCVHIGPHYASSRMSVLHDRRDRLMRLLAARKSREKTDLTLKNQRVAFSQFDNNILLESADAQ